jgi:hypothetical protein
LFGPRKDSGVTTASSSFDDYGSEVLGGSNNTPATPEQLGNSALAGSPSTPTEASPTAAALAVESRIDDSYEFAHSFGSNRDRWEKMKTFEIIADALATSNLSLALAFLRWRSKQRFAGYSSDSGVLLTHELRQMSYRLVYQAVRRSQFNLAVKMINSLGDSVDANYKEMLWSTTIRHVRAHLLKQLQQGNKIALPSELDTLRTFFVFRFPFAVFFLFCFCFCFFFVFYFLRQQLHP